MRTRHTANLYGILKYRHLVQEYTIYLLTNAVRSRSCQIAVSERQRIEHRHVFERQLRYWQQQGRTIAQKSLVSRGDFYLQRAGCGKPVRCTMGLNTERSPFDQRLPIKPWLTSVILPPNSRTSFRLANCHDHGSIRSAEGALEPRTTGRIRRCRTAGPSSH